MQYDGKADSLKAVNKSKSLMSTLQLYTGYTPKEIMKMLKQKEEILKWMIKQQVKSVDSVGRVVAEYYTDPDNLMKFVRNNKKFSE